MKTPRTPKELQTLPLMIVNQSLVLATSAFGLAAALAWNETIKIVITTYIQPYLGKDSGLISQIIYTIFVTALAVIITLQLTRAKEVLEKQLNADKSKVKKVSGKKGKKEKK